MSAWIRWSQVLALQVMLLVLGVVSIVWNLLALVLRPVLPTAFAIRVGRAVIARVYRTLWATAGWLGMLKMDATALDALKDEPGLIVVANHPTAYDALMIVARLPRVACVMKASLMINPFLGPGAALAHYIRNDTAIGTIRACVKDLKRGGQLVLFPEGTRTMQFPINDFRPGVTVIARLAKAPIQTVFIDTDSPFGGKGWPLWKLPPLPVHISVRLGKRFEPERDDEAMLQSLHDYFAAGVTTNVVENLNRAHAVLRDRGATA